MYSGSRPLSVRNITVFRQLESHSFLFRLIIGGLVIAACFLFLPFLVTSLDSNSVQAQGTDLSYDSLSATMPDSSNVITSSLATMMNEAGQTAYQVKDGATKSTRSFSSATAKSSRIIIGSTAQGAKATIEGVGNGLSFIGAIAGNGISFVFSIPGNTLDIIARAPVINNILRPSDHQDVPLIDPNSPELLAALTALPPTSPAASNQAALPHGADGPVWPIHGRITTQFGVNHRPYQDTHTGLDISDGQRSGVTQIKPFRSGRVIETIHSRYGYGNHVIIDHGNGVTSVYAHLYSISVEVGQQVTTNTVIGLEGSTGLSTGTHLHFEVRVNGKAADPHKFITGQP